MSKLRQAYWRIFGRPDFPPRNGFVVRSKMNLYTDKPYWPRYALMALHYVNGASVSELAQQYNVTHERVRQCLWKAYNESN